MKNGDGRSRCGHATCREGEITGRCYYTDGGGGGGAHNNNDCGWATDAHLQAARQLAEVAPVTPYDDPDPADRHGQPVSYRHKCGSQDMYAYMTWRHIEIVAMVEKADANSRGACCVLWMIDSRLAPPPGQTGRLPDWLVNVNVTPRHARNDGPWTGRRRRRSQDEIAPAVASKSEARIMQTRCRDGMESCSYLPSLPKSGTSAFSRVEACAGAVPHVWCYPKGTPQHPSPQGSPRRLRTARTAPWQALGGSPPDKRIAAPRRWRAGREGFQNASRVEGSRLAGWWCCYTT